MQIILTDYAKLQIKSIVLYYREHASSNVATSIKTSIFNRLKLLSSLSVIGQHEFNLDIHGLDHRYLVEGNFKIIYRIQGSRIFVTDIFDTRQNPNKANP